MRFLICVSTLMLITGCSTLPTGHVTTSNQRIFEIGCLESIGYGLRSYFFIHGHFPPTGSNVIVLGQPDSEASGTASMPMTKQQLRSGRYLDIWGSNYILQTCGSICRVSSKGADRVFGTVDDFILRVSPTNQSFVSLPVTK